MSNVLVTGCSSGFGYLASLGFARQGHTVFATMRDLAKAAPLQELPRRKASSSPSSSSTSPIPSPSSGR